MAERNRKLTEILLFIFAIFVVVVAGINTHYYHSIYNATVEETVNVNPTVVSQTAAYNWMIVNIILLVVAVIYLIYRTWVFFFSYELRQDIKSEIRDWNSETRPWQGIIGKKPEYGYETEYVPFFGDRGVVTSKSYLNKGSVISPAKLKYNPASNISKQPATRAVGGSDTDGFLVIGGPGGSF